MRQNSTDNRLVRNLVIVMDFVILNVLFFIYVNLDTVDQLWLGGVKAVSLQMLANMAFAVAQFFFSNVVHDRRSTSDLVLKQVSSLMCIFLITMYLLTWTFADYENIEPPRFMFHVWFAFVLYAFILLSRNLEGLFLRKYHSTGHNLRHVVFVGSDSVLLPIYEYLSDSSMGYDIVGYYSDGEMDECPKGLVHKGTLDDFRSLMQNNGEGGESVDELYCALLVAERDTIRQIIRYCNNNVIHFYYVPPFTKLLGQSFSQERVGDTTVFTNYGEPLMLPTNQLIKRSFDIVVSSFVLLCLLPFIPFIAAIIYIQSPGPIFFKQLRTGLNGRSFYCYKFRSMHVNKDADLVQATEHDPRKFAFGSFMRKANIDELPQFFNVLKGNMSIVGPRPHMLHHTEVYRQLIDKYMVRHFVKPGITGWAQVTGYRGETKELWQMEGRVKRDIWYIENWSIWLDLRICWKTAVQMVVHDKNAY